MKNIVCKEFSTHRPSTQQYLGHVILISWHSMYTSYYFLSTTISLLLNWLGPRIQYPIFESQNWRKVFFFIVQDVNGCLKTQFNVTDADGSSCKNCPKCPPGEELSHVWNKHTTKCYVNMRPQQTRSLVFEQLWYLYLYSLFAKLLRGPSSTWVLCTYWKYQMEQTV